MRLLLAVFSLAAGAALGDAVRGLGEAIAEDGVVRVRDVGLDADDDGGGAAQTLDRALFLAADGTFCHSCYERAQRAEHSRAAAFRAHHQARLGAERAVTQASRSAAVRHRAQEATFRRERLATMARTRQDAARAAARVAADHAAANRAVSGARSASARASAKLARLRARATARRRAEEKAQMSVRCEKLDCENPKRCLNRAGRRIASGRAEEAVKKGGRWYKREGSLQYWTRCAWVESVARCHPTDPTLERHGTRWVKRAYSKRRNFVHRAGRWYRSATSNEFYSNCRWVRRAVRRNCKDPSVRWLAGRWVPRSRAERSKFRRIGGVWYLGTTNRRFVYRNCRWVPSQRHLAANAARTLGRRQQRLKQDKRKLSKWQSRWKSYLAKDYAKLARAHPVRAAVNKVTYADMHRLVTEIVPRVGDRTEQRMAENFLRDYIPREPESRRPAPRRAGRATRLHPLQADTNGEHVMFVDELDPEGNGAREEFRDRAHQSSQDFEDPPQQNTVDSNDPERGVSGGSEPGKQFRNVGKSTDEQFHVVGEEEMLRNPVVANDQVPLMNHPSRDPSLSRI
jgi:hypothetical protein